MDSLEDYIQYENFSNLLPGGLENQPAEWVDAVMCCKSAYKRAESEWEEHNRKQQEEAQKRQNKGKGAAKKGKRPRRRR